MDEPRRAQGLIDTSVIIDLHRIEARDLPATMAVSAVSLAELVADPLATDDPAERARRQDRLQRTEATFEALAADLPVDTCNPDDFEQLADLEVITVGRRP